MSTHEGAGFVAFTWARSRYAKGLEVVKPHKDGSGFKTREARLAEHFARRYSHREGGYLMSTRAIGRMLRAYEAGQDASPITGELR